MPTEIFHSWLFSVAVSPMSKIHISYISKKSFSRISVSEGSTWILNKTQEKNWWAFCAIQIKGNLAHLWGRWWLIKKYNLSAYQFSPFFQIFSRYKHFLVGFIFNLIVAVKKLRPFHQNFHHYLVALLMLIFFTSDISFGGKENPLNLSVCITFNTWWIRNESVNFNWNRISRLHSPARWVGAIHHYKLAIYEKISNKSVNPTA